MKKTIQNTCFAFLVFFTACNRQSFVATATQPQQLKHVSNRKEKLVKIYMKYQEAPADAVQLGFMSSSNVNTDKVAVKVRNFTARAGGDMAVFIDKTTMEKRTDINSNTYVAPGLLQKKYNYVILKSK